MMTTEEWNDKPTGTQAPATPEKIWVQWPQENGTGLAFTCQARPPALRQGYTRDDLSQAANARAEQAEARIDALEAKLAKAVTALTSIADNTCCGGCQEAALVARAAIKGEPK
jgi:hypothetical protein